jgi:hypothetical protein
LRAPATALRAAARLLSASSKVLPCAAGDVTPALSAFPAARPSALRRSRVSPTSPRTV